VGGHVHNTNVGGAVPALLSQTLTEIQQEVLVSLPAKIVRARVLNEELVRLMEINVRAPEQNRGDLNAQTVMSMTGERRILEIIERFGVEASKQGRLHRCVDLVSYIHLFHEACPPISKL